MAWRVPRFGQDAGVTDPSVAPPWVAAHEEACAAGELQYRDPETGYRVFTEVGLRQRGECCGCGCRHCPWAHEAVPAPIRAMRIARPAWLHGSPPSDRPLVVVFWSGGKDSFLAARRALRERPDATIALLTTFGHKTKIVAHQELPIETVVDQARALDRPLLGVPLYPGADYTRAVVEALRYVAQQAPLTALVFGDLHLDHIRRWREEQFAPLVDEMGLQMEFPLWGCDYHVLQQELEDSGVEARICASPDFARIAPVRQGDRFGADLMARLPAGVDAFGECGEFHTEVIAEGLRPQHLAG